MNKEYEATENRAQSARIVMSDQLDEMDRLLAIAHEHLGGLSNTLEPVLLSEPKEDSSPDADPSSDWNRLSPHQQRLMGQYNSLNRLIEKIDGLSRRAQI